MPRFATQEERDFGLMGFNDAYSKQEPRSKRVAYLKGWQLGGNIRVLDAVANQEIKAIGLTGPDPVPTKKESK